MSLAQFGIRKPVAVNLLMLAIIGAGIAAGITIGREFFPEIKPRIAWVELRLPGASAQEVEESLAIKVEDKLTDLDEVKELRTRLVEGGGTVSVEFREGINVDEALDEVERAIDSLTDLPEEAEKIQVRLMENNINVIRLTLFGEADEAEMKREANRIKDELGALDGMGRIVITGVREYEVSVNVDAKALLSHHLSLTDLAEAITKAMAEVPGGIVRTEAGDVQIRTRGAAEHAQAIREIVLRQRPDGSTLRVQDVAQVRDGFVDDPVITRYNGHHAAHLVVFKVGDQDIITMARMVQAYAAGRSGEPWHASLFDRLLRGEVVKAWELGVATPRALPPGVQIEPNLDFARFVDGRLELLMRNAGYGAILVFCTLLAFLNWRAALWVGLGLFTAIMGTLVLMVWLGTTLNLMTMFGLIIVLGLMVDDAIVVSENIQSRVETGEPPLQGAVNATDQVAWPVVATVMTTIVAFAPLIFVRGGMGELLGALPIVVGAALTMSLVEALLILPSHLGHSLKKRAGKIKGRAAQFVGRAEAWRDHILMDRIAPWYVRQLDRALRYRYLHVALAVAALVMVLGLVQGGRVGFTFLGATDSEHMLISVQLPVGSSAAQTQATVQTIEEVIEATPEVKSVSSVVGQRTDFDTAQLISTPSHMGQMFVELKLVEERDRESGQVIADIRRQLRTRLVDVERVTFAELSGGPGGPDITVRLTGAETEALQNAAFDVKQALASYKGVLDVYDDLDAGQPELQVDIKPRARALGLTSQNVATQLRAMVYGIDAHVFAAQREDIDVRVRLNKQSRSSLGDIEHAWITTPGGETVPLTEVADVSEGASLTSIRRIDRRRAIDVFAETDPALRPESVVAELPLDQLRRNHPGVEITLTGRQQQEADAFGSLPLGFIASLLMIYFILAWLFDNYAQPVLVMLVIPFAWIGVVLGHMALGYDITFLSLIGFVALSGIVVNDSLILVDFYNHNHRQGKGVTESLLAAGRGRLRAILLTSITTILGLTPLILEQSFQAKFIIPMAISIAGGLLSATVLVLILAPCLLKIYEDIANAVHLLWFGTPREQPMPDEDVSVPHPMP